MRILIIEDDRLITRILMRECRKRGHRYYGVDSVERATALLQTVARNGEQLDAVISDLSLPDGSGLDVARAFPDLADRFVFFTGEPAESSLRGQATLVGPVFSKGVDAVGELFDAVEARSK